MTLISPTTEPPFAALAPTPRTLDRHFWIAMLVATVVLLGRSWPMLFDTAADVNELAHLGLEEST